MKWSSFVVAASLGACFFSSNPTARAQQVKADQGAVAVRGNVIGSTISIGIPPEQLAALVKQTTDLSEAQKKLITNLEGQLDLNQRQVRAALEILGEVDCPPEQLASKLFEFARRFKDLQAEVAARPENDPKVAALRADVQNAIDGGDLAGADVLLAKIETEQKQSRDHAVANLAETAARRGDVALTRFRYAEAAAHFANAASMFPIGSAHEDERIDYLHREASALYSRGDIYADSDALRSAIELYRTLANLRPRDREPLEWAQIQNSLGSTLEKLGERENGTARLEEAVGAYRNALTIREARSTRAMALNNLGTALSTLGERETGTARLEEAVLALRQALQEGGSTDISIDWAQTQNNLGTVLAALAERENGTARLEEAIVAYRQAMTVFAREQIPWSWARTANNLGTALQRLGARGTGTAPFERSGRQGKAGHWQRGRVRQAQDGRCRSGT
jgi:tetratricopeptide (TPR) repeat protein